MVCRVQCVVQVVEEEEHHILEHRRRAVLGHHVTQLNREEGGEWYPMYR